MKNNDTPKVTILITAHNEKKLLLRSVLSIISNEDKEFLDKIQVLICLDRPDLETRSISHKEVASLLISRGINFYILETSVASGFGISASRNLGVSKAAGDYISFLDADDLFISRKLSRLMTSIENSGLGTVGIVYHDYYINVEYTSSYTRHGLLSTKTSGLRYAAHREIGFSTVFVDSRLAKDNKFYELDTAEDVDWLIRIIECCDKKNLPKLIVHDCLSIYTVRAGSRSSRKVRNAFNIFSIYKEHFGVPIGFILFAISCFFWISRRLRNLYFSPVYAQSDVGLDA